MKMKFKKYQLAILSAITTLLFGVVTFINHSDLLNRMLSVVFLLLFLGEIIRAIQEWENENE